MKLWTIVRWAPLIAVMALLPVAWIALPDAWRCLKDDLR
jgi:hypothetical protein